MPRDLDKIPRAVVLPQRIQDARKTAATEVAHEQHNDAPGEYPTPCAEADLAKSHPTEALATSFAPVDFSEASYLPILALRYVQALVGSQLNFAFTDFQVLLELTILSKLDAKLPFANSTWKRRTRCVGPGVDSAP